MNFKGFKNSQIYRWIILLVVLVSSMIIHYLHINSDNQYPSVHAICPFGGLENLWAFVSGYANIQKIFTGTMALFFMTIIFTILFRRSFCGNICPLGVLQELFKKFVPKKINVPKKLDFILTKIKYLILVLSVIMAWKTLTLWLSPYDPWAAFSHISKGEELFEEYLIGFIILIALLIVSLFINRSFCRYLCPAGAFYAIVSKLSPVKINRNKDTCTDCGLCTKNCPVDIEVHKMDSVKTSECISCSRCIDVCPTKENSLSINVGKKKINTIVFLILGLFVFFGSIVVMDLAGIYKVSIPSEEEIVKEEDYIRIQDLRGSMTIEEGAFYTGTEIEEFYELMEIPKDVPKDTLLKSVYTYVPDYDFHEVKATKEK